MLNANKKTVFLVCGKQKVRKKFMTIKIYANVSN